MSSNKRNDTNRSRLVTKKVSTKIQAVGDNTLDYSGANLLPFKEGFSVVIASNVNRSFMTYHHPIGVTLLDDACWIATEASQIQSLLSRQVDPRRRAIDVARTLHRFTSAIAVPLLLEEGGEYYYPSDATFVESRKSRVTAARREAKEANDLSLDAYVSRLALVHRNEEVAIKGYLSRDTTIDAAVGANPYPVFTTRSGLHESVEQEAVGYLNQMPIAEAKLAVIRRLLGN